MLPRAACYAPASATPLPSAWNPHPPRGSAVMASLLSEILPMMSSCLQKGRQVRVQVRDPCPARGEVGADVNGWVDRYCALGCPAFPQMPRFGSPAHTPHRVLVQHVEGQMVEIQGQVHGVLLPPEGAQAPPDGCCPAKGGTGGSLGHTGSRYLGTHTHRHIHTQSYSNTNTATHTHSHRPKNPDIELQIHTQTITHTQRPGHTHTHRNKHS